MNIDRPCIIWSGDKTLTSLLGLGIPVKDELSTFENGEKDLLDTSVKTENTEHPMLADKTQPRPVTTPCKSVSPWPLRPTKRSDG